ncbi:MAG: hypothetical protein KatS3mg028_0338 [Bacteroidia bacterium]|nr:MAG: hypothetical protein KatS3mg028_0338 [Bacteroidia bacterium]
MHKKIVFAGLLTACLPVCAQDDLLSLTESKPEKQYVFAAWKAYRLGNAQTTETVKKNHLEYRILHRFGNIADNTKTFNQIAHTAFGIDNPTDIRMSLEYGLTNDITLGIGRSRINELVDISGKWRFVKQTTDFKTPVSIALFESIGYTTMTTDRLYSEVAVKNFSTRETHRLNYVTQLIIGSKINNRISVEILPTWFHRNFIVQKFNPNTGRENGNDNFILGAAARVKLSNRVTIFADYFYNFHPFFNNNPDYGMPLSIGFEIETGGHVFTLYFANNPAIVENNFFIGSVDKWSKSQIKFSFCISRTFSLKKEE